MLDQETIEKLKNKKVFSLEGNIGAGKTTILKLISKTFKDVELVEEPVGQWQNLGGANLLEKFYSDPERWAFSFEFFSMLSKMKNLLIKASNSDKEVVIIERSLLSNKVFIDVSFELGKIDPMEYRILCNMYDFFKLHVYPHLSGIIYIDTPVDECISRITIRNRGEETGIEKSYLELLKKKFDQFAEDVTLKVHVLNGKYDILRDSVRVSEEVHQFLCPISSPSTSIDE